MSELFLLQFLFCGCINERIYFFNRTEHEQDISFKSPDRLYDFADFFRHGRRCLRPVVL